MSGPQLEQIAPHLHLQMLADVYSRADEFDIVHAHTDIWTLPFAQSCTIPTVVTMHGRLDLEVVRTILPMYADTPLVSISDHQRLAVADLPAALDGHVPERTRPVRVLRRAEPRRTATISPSWGGSHRRSDPTGPSRWRGGPGRPLRVAAKIDPLDVDYWHTVIEPLFRSYDVDFVGEIGEAEKPAFFAEAAATLFPIDWPEPFGLVMIESLASGTPVIALRNGSVPEVLDRRSVGIRVRLARRNGGGGRPARRTDPQRLPDRGGSLHRGDDDR